MATKSEMLSRFIKGAKWTHTKDVLCTTTLIGYEHENDSYSSIRITFTEGCTADGVHIWREDSIGREYKVSFGPTTEDTACRIVRDDANIYVGELIVQLDRLANGLPILDGEFNHKIPKSIWRDAMIEERFGIEYGEILTSHSDNCKHGNFCRRVLAEAGLVVVVSATNQEAMKLLNKKRITTDDVLKLPYIKQPNGYIILK